MLEMQSSVLRFALLVSVHSTDMKRPGNGKVVFFFFFFLKSTFQIFQHMRKKVTLYLCVALFEIKIQLERSK